MVYPKKCRPNIKCRPIKGRPKNGRPKKMSTKKNVDPDMADPQKVDPKKCRHFEFLSRPRSTKKTIKDWKSLKSGEFFLVFQVFWIFSANMCLIKVKNNKWRWYSPRSFKWCINYHVIIRQETNILSPEGLSRSISVVYY